MKFSPRCALIFLALFAKELFAAEFSFTVLPAPEWNQLFQRTNGWIGADAAFSIPLATNQTLWLFGDTFVGEIRDGKRIDSRMIHNSIAVQNFGAAPIFFYPTNETGEPESFLKFPDGTNYFWLMDGARTQRGLFFFLAEIKTVDASTFGFRGVSTWLAFVKNPDDPPVRWKISEKKLPFENFSDGEKISFGCATFSDGRFVYIYGNAYFENSSGQKNLILARAPENQLDNFGAWKFFSKGDWTNNFQNAAPIFSGAPPEGSVSWQPFLKKFVFIYTDGIWGKIVMRTADAPQGPWSAPVTIYQCPEMKISPNIFCYAGKAHPKLGATNELLISYAANSQNFSDLINDAGIYWPRFVRVKFASR